MATRDSDVKKNASSNDCTDEELKADLHGLLRSLIPEDTFGLKEQGTANTQLVDMQRRLETAASGPDGNVKTRVNDANDAKAISNDKNCLLPTLATDGMLLENASEALRADREVVLVAVTQNGRALKFASPSLQADKEVVLRAIQQHFSAFHFASKDLVQSDKDVMLAAVADRYSSALNYATKEQKSDRDIIMTSVSRNGHQLSMASKELQADKEIVLVAVTRRGEALKHASEDLRADKDVVMAAVANDSSALKYALGGLNQDRECWVAAGLVPKEESIVSTIGAVPSSTTTLSCGPKRKIILSTKFSLSEQSKSSTTHLTALLAETPYFQGEEAGGDGVFVVYSPNAFGKCTCDPDWTTMEWPCRGTYETCRKPPKVKTGIPTDDSCWRYSYRYHLTEAKHTNGFMMQVVDYDKEANQHLLGKGQQIETIMANQVGTKVFRVCQPCDQGIGMGLTPYQFAPRHVSEIVSHIKDWYKSGCADTTGCEIQLWSIALRDEWKTVARKLGDNELDVQRMCPWNW